MNAQTVQRRYELDWLRVLAILAIFVFHCSRPFDADDWSIKNPTTSIAMNVTKDWANAWGMPLITLPLCFGLSSLIRRLPYAQRVL